MPAVSSGKTTTEWNNAGRAGKAPVEGPIQVVRLASPAGHSTGREDLWVPAVAGSGGISCQTTVGSSAVSQDLMAPVRARFMELTRQWKRDRPPSSSTSALAVHDAYQRIIGLGQPAIPLILAEMEREPDFWFWALRALTGVNPVRPEDRGDLDAMTRAWLKWAKEAGYQR